MKKLLWISAALLANASAAHAEIVELTWEQNGRFERRLQVAPGKFAELCGKLAPGMKVRWQFDAAAPLNFNIHYHEGKEVRFPARHDGVQRMQGALDVPSAQDYCWMWTNKGRDGVTLSVQLVRE